MRQARWVQEKGTRRVSLEFIESEEIVEETTQISQSLNELKAEEPLPCVFEKAKSEIANPQVEEIQSQPRDSERSDPSPAVLEAEPSPQAEEEEAREIDVVNEGWIMLHRKILRNEIFTDSETLQLFIYFLLRASYKSHKFIFNGEFISLERGQLITSLRSIQRDIKLRTKRIRARLKLLERTHMIEVKTAHRFSIVTIVNYNVYQNNNQTKGHTEKETKGHTEKETKGHTEGTLRAQYNKDKKKKYYVGKSEPLRLAILLLKEIRKNKLDFKEPNLQGWAKHIDFMLRLDGRSTEAIERVIQWVQADHGDGGRWKGWASNILSPGKLREKFDELELKMQAGNGTKDKLKAKHVILT